MRLHLYGHPDSGHACKVALALALADLPHRTERVDIWAAPESRPAAFRAANPAGVVPVLVRDGAPLVQSGAILLEIAAMSRRLGGESAERLARARAHLFWEANRIGMCLPQLCEARRTGEMAPQVVDWLTARFRTDDARFALLIGDASFLGGPAPDIADCAVWGYAQWVDRAGVAPGPALSRWIERMRALPHMRAPEEFFPA